MLIAGALEDLVYTCVDERYDLNHYRMKIEECGPILNSLCDRV
ncbi:unnamed protein product, partial [marine sediment metagenome]